MGSGVVGGPLSMIGITMVASSAADVTEAPQAGQ
jgi:hypothetical protein